MQEHLLIMPGLSREELAGKVLAVKDMVAYQTGAIASRMIVFKKAGTVTIFAFDAGEGLSEHTAPYDALLTVVDGEAEVQAGSESHTVHEGELIILPANTPHAVTAKKRFTMMLTMIRE